MSTIYEKMTAVADAIRNKTGGTELLTLDDMAIEIAGISTGVETDDATATAGDILENKTAYVNGEKITGTIPTVTQATPTINVDSAGKITASSTQEAGYVSTGTKIATQQLTVQAAQTITPGTSNKTIASGRYLTGTQTIAGDADLVAGNIKKGVNIFGVAGSFDATSEVLNFNVIGGIGRPYSLVDCGNFKPSTNTTATVVKNNGITITSTSGTWQGVTYNTTFPVSVGEVWNFTADVDAGYTTSYINMGIRGYDSSGAVLNDNKLLISSMVSSNNKMSFSYTIPSGTAYISLLILVSDGGSSTHGTATIRNIKAGVAANVASENTIWVETDTVITSYAFSPIQPVSSTGMLWIYTTSEESNVEFNALSSNAIQVRPFMVKQYVNNAWETKTAKSYQNGRWIAWDVDSMIFENGEFSTKFCPNGVTYTSSSNVYIEDNATYGKVLVLRYSYGVVTNDLIDLTPWKAIEVNFVSRYDSAPYIAIFDSTNTEVARASNGRASTAMILQLDVEAIQGKYYIKVSGAVGNASDGRNAKVGYIKLVS